MTKADKHGAPRRESGVTLAALGTFVQAVDCGGFSRAAAALGVSQPNVSNQISALEAALGLRLLNRRSSPQTLTDAGRDIYTRARLVLSRMADLEVSAKDFEALRKGTLRIGFSSPRMALRGIARFMADHPGITVSTRAGNTDSLRRDVQECAIDLGLFSLREPDPQLSCTCLARHRLELLTAAGSDTDTPAQISLTALAGMPLIGREHGSMTRALTEALFARNGLAYQPALTVSGAQAQYEAVLAQVGSAIVFADQAEGDRRFTSHEIADSDIEAGLYLVTLPENLEIPAVAAFRAAILAEAEARG